MASSRANNELTEGFAWDAVSSSSSGFFLLSGRTLGSSSEACGFNFQMLLLLPLSLPLARSTMAVEPRVLPLLLTAIARTVLGSDSPSPSRPISVSKPTRDEFARSLGEEVTFFSSSPAYCHRVSSLLSHSKFHGNIPPPNDEPGYRHSKTHRC